MAAPPPGDISLKENERQWRNLFEAGRQALKEAIETMKLRCTTVLEQRGEDIDHATWQGLLDEDLHMAHRALAEDNAPGVERALARLEASLIQLSSDGGGEIVVAPKTVVSDGTDVMDVSALSTSVLNLEVNDESVDDVPFVDLTGNSSLEEE